MGMWLIRIYPDFRIFWACERCFVFKGDSGYLLTVLQEVCFTKLLIFGKSMSLGQYIRTKLYKSTFSRWIMCLF